MRSAFCGSVFAAVRPTAAIGMITDSGGSIRGIVILCPQTRCGGLVDKRREDALRPDTLMQTGQTRSWRLLADEAGHTLPNGRGRSVATDVRGHSVADRPVAGTTRRPIYGRRAASRFWIPGAPRRSLPTQTTASPMPQAACAGPGTLPRSNSSPPAQSDRQTWRYGENIVSSSCHADSRLAVCDVAIPLARGTSLRPAGG